MRLSQASNNMIPAPNSRNYIYPVSLTLGLQMQAAPNVSMCPLLYSSKGEEFQYKTM